LETKINESLLRDFSGSQAEMTAMLELEEDLNSPRTAVPEGDGCQSKPIKIFAGWPIADPLIC
jgi:hypothetical protein